MLQGFIWIVSLHLIATLGLEWRLAAFQHGKYSFMCTSRWFKSSCLPKAAVTPLPARPAPFLPPRCPPRRLPARLLHGCTGSCAAAASLLGEQQSVFTRIWLQVTRNSTKTRASAKAGEEQGRIGAAESGQSGSALLAVMMLYASLNCTWNSRRS